VKAVSQLAEEDVVYGDTFAVKHLWGMKRRFLRYGLTVPVRVAYGRGLGATIVTGLTRDIALGGMGFITPEPLGVPERDVVMLKFGAHGLPEPLVISGIVAYENPRDGVGVRFPELAGRTRTRLKQLLTSMAAWDKPSRPL
jgi:hypothetical protein